MQLSYFHVASDVPAGQPEAAIVIDVLRATTTIAWAFKNGADAIETFADLDELRERSGRWPRETLLLLGERGGKRIEGFDLGNSPLSVDPGRVAGKRLLMSTTNGTQALDRVKNAAVLYTASLVNRSAVGKRLLLDRPNEVWIVGSGWEGSYSLEDSLAAGSLASFLLENGKDSVSVVNDELVAALALWSYWKDDLEGCLRRATHGQRLSGLSDHDQDFKCCSELDRLEVVPYQKEPGVLRAS